MNPTVEQIAGVLGEHIHLANDCKCGYAIRTQSPSNPLVYYISLPSEAYRAHVAAVIADLYAEGES